MSEEFTFAVPELAVTPVFTGFPYPSFMTIAPWCAKRVYALMGQNAVAVLTEKGIKPDSVRASNQEVTSETWQTVYFKESRQLEANAAAACFPSKIKTPTASLQRMFYAKCADTLPVSQFDLTWEQHEVGFGAGKRWQPWNLVTVPSMVHAYAVARGWDVPELAFREISDAKNIQVDFNIVPALWDTYLNQRRELWAALDEPEAKNSLYQGAKDSKGKPVTAGVTTSEKLSEALKFALGEWTGKYYTAMGQCGHPEGNPANVALGYLTKLNKERIVVCNGLWPDKTAAEAFVAARGHKDEPATVPVVVSKYADLPFPDEFKEMTIEDFFVSVYSDTLVKDEIYTKATSIAAKIAAKKVLEAKLAEYGQTVESWDKIKALVTG